MDKIRNNIPYMESIDSGSNYQFGDKMIISQTPKSLFDLTHLVTTTIDNAGEIVPLGQPILTVPGDDMEFSVDSLIRVLAQEVPLYSRQRMYIYGFYSPFSSLWNNFETFAKKGYSGNVLKQFPKYSNSNTVLRDFDNRSISSNTVKVGSIADYSGLPHNFDYTGTLPINCLNSMMNLRVLRDYFLNKDFFINDRLMLPDDDTRFRLDDDGQLLSAKDVNKLVCFDFGNKFDVPMGLCYGSPDEDGLQFVKGDYDNDRTLVFSKMYHLFPSDRFTSAKPFVQRGDEPKLDFNISFSGDGSYASIYHGAPGPGYSALEKAYLSKLSSTDIDSFGYSVGNVSATSSGYTSLKVTGNPDAVPSDAYKRQLVLRGEDLVNLVGEGNLSVGLNAIRELAIKQTELEKMARTDGTYAQFGLTFFGVKSKNCQDFRPVYIGGTVVNLQFSEVLQTSSGTSDSPLGNYAGHGIGSNGNNSGYIGKIFADDYGMIQFYACIMPDIYYSQGVSKQWTMSTQSDLYLPDRAKLGMIPVLNYEIYGNSQNPSDLFAYQNPFDEYRYMENSVHGKIADMSNNSFAPYTQSRKFDEQPIWSREFATADNVRKDYLSAPTEVAYTAQFKINCRAVRPIPYRPVPGQILN